MNRKIYKAPSGNRYIAIDDNPEEIGVCNKCDCKGMDCLKAKCTGIHFKFSLFQKLINLFK